MDPKTGEEIVYYNGNPQQLQDAPSVIIDESMNPASTVEIVTTSENEGESHAPKNRRHVESCASCKAAKNKYNTNCEFRKAPKPGVVETVFKKVTETGPCKKLAVLTTVEEHPAAKTPENNEESGKNHAEGQSSGDSDKLTCHLCGRRFSKLRSRSIHIAKVHSEVTAPKLIKCIECNTNFCSLRGLREHLADEHNLEMVEHRLLFPNMEAFHKWKYEIERETLSFYALSHGRGRGAFGPRNFYFCHRSGQYRQKTKYPKRMRRFRTHHGSVKMGIVCTSAIDLYTTPNQVHVRFCPNHYGHGKETKLTHLNGQQHNAIKESVPQGMSYDKFLDEIRDAQSSEDYFQLKFLQKKDLKSINNALSFDNFNSSISDAESVDHWIGVCCQMENSPILFYRNEELLNDKKKQEEFILIIMTEYQKHILQSSDKKIICVDPVCRSYVGKLSFTVMLIIDENGHPFPVAYCISNKIDQNVISTFYQTLKEAVGELSCQFFITGYESFYFDMWKIVMNNNPRWLWSMSSIDAKVRRQLQNVAKDNEDKVQKRSEVYKTMRMLLECQNPTVFQYMLKNLAENLKKDPDFKELGNQIEQQYAQDAEMWACCYRKEIDLSTNIHLELMHRTLKHCCVGGRKTRLDKFIFIIMKYGRDKLLQRLCSLLDDEKIEIALTSINECHKLGVKIPKESITTLSDKTWFVQIEEEEDSSYVTREYEKCPEMCNLKCGECSICVHMYVCSCIHNLINANLCPHIHAVVWHLLTPHASPTPSPTPSPVHPLDEAREEEAQAESSVFSNIVELSRDVCEKIKASKTNLSTSALSSLRKHLSDCIDICDGKLVDDEDESKKRKTGNPPTYFLPFIPTNNSFPVTSSKKIESILSHVPHSSVGYNQSHISHETAHFDGSSDAIIPNIVSAPCTSAKPVPVSNAVLVSINNCQFVISPTVSTTRSYPVVKPPTISTTSSDQVLAMPYTASKTAICTTSCDHPVVMPYVAPTTSHYHPVAKPPTVSTTCYQHSVVVPPTISTTRNSQKAEDLPANFQTPTTFINSIRPTFKLPEIAYVTGSDQSMWVPNRVSAPSTYSIPMEVPNALPRANSNHPVMNSPAVSTTNSYHPIAKPSTVSTKCNQFSLAVSLTSNSQKSEIPLTNFQPPIYTINSLPKKCSGKQEYLLLSEPICSLHDSSSFISSKIVSVPENDQSLLMPNSISTPSSSTQKQMPNPMLSLNINRPVVTSSVSRTSCYHPVTMPPTVSTNCNQRSIAVPLTVCTTSNSQTPAIASTNFQPPISMIDSLSKTSNGKTESLMLSEPFPSSESPSFKLLKTAAVSDSNKSVLIPNETQNSPKRIPTFPKTLIIPRPVRNDYHSVVLSPTAKVANLWYAFQ